MLELQLEQKVQKAENIDDLSACLELLLNSGCSVWDEPSGEQKLLFTRALVERINGLKIEIYSNEHVPPHFHVKSANINAAFAIDDCALISGSVDGKTKRLITYYHKLSRGKLITFWNETRPTGCPVGPIIEFPK
jgi:hypothetical protein